MREMREEDREKMQRGKRKKGKERERREEKRREEKRGRPFTRGKFLKSSHFASRFSLLTSFSSTYCLRGTSLKRQSPTLGGMLTFGAKISIQARLS